MRSEREAYRAVLRPMPAPGRWLRRILVALVAMGLLGSAGWVALHRDPEPGIWQRRGVLAAVLEEPEVAGEGVVDRDVLLVSSSGLEVELAVRRPADGGATPLPAVLLLGGHRTGRDAARLVGAAEGVVVAALSYPTDRRRIRGVRDALEVRRAIADTPAAVMLAVDYLAALAFVDPERVELAGVSLGAPFACVAGALDPRIRRVWSIHGGGDPRRLVAHSLEDEVAFAPARGAAALLVHLFAHGPTLAPEAWVGRISPRPFVMINAEEDARIPRACVELLFAAAGDPKELVWLPGEHVDRDRDGIVRTLRDLVLERIHSNP